MASWRTRDPMSSRLPNSALFKITLCWCPFRVLDIGTALKLRGDLFRAVRPTQNKAIPRRLGILARKHLADIVQSERIKVFSLKESVSDGLAKRFQVDGRCSRAVPVLDRGTTNVLLDMRNAADLLA
jgi:hypothetical protein